MRRALVAFGVLLVLAGTTTPAAASTSYKGVSVYHADDGRLAFSIGYYQGSRDLSVYWTEYAADGTRSRWITEDDGGLPGGEFHSYRLWWATLTFDDPYACLYSSPPAPGADEEGCVESELVGDLRWDAYSHRYKDVASDGTIRYFRWATLSGDVTIDGESLLADPMSVQIYRVVPAA